MRNRIGRKHHELTSMYKKRWSYNFEQENFLQIIPYRLYEKNLYHTVSINKNSKVKTPKCVDFFFQFFVAILL